MAEKILAFVGASFLSWLLGSLVEELSIHLEDRSQTLIGILEHISELFLASASRSQYRSGFSLASVVV